MIDAGIFDGDPLAVYATSEARDGQIVMPLARRSRQRAPGGLMN
jgi:SOS-response transcriptional repressor LexA